MKHSYFTDENLINGIADGKTEAIEWVYDSIQPMIIKWMIARGAQESIAEDVFQEGMMVLYHQCRKDSFKLTSKVSTYLLAVCKRLWYKQIEQNKRTVLQESFNDEGALVSDEEINAIEQKEIDFLNLEAAMVMLGSPCKELLEAFYLHGDNMQELATKFNYTNSDTAKTQRYKCMNRLRKIMNS